MARVGGGAGFAGRRWCGQVVGSTATVKVKSDSQVRRLRRRLRGERPRSGEWGSRCSGGGRCLWSPLSRIPRRFVARREPSRPGRCQAGSLLLWSPFRPAGHRPVRDGCASTAEATGNPGQPRSVVWTGSTRRGTAAARRRVREAREPFPQAGLSRIPRRFGGRSQAGRAGGVKSLIPGHQLRRSDLIPPDRSASVRRRCDGESGTEATTSSVRRPAARPPTPRSEAARRAGAAGGALDSP